MNDYRKNFRQFVKQFYPKDFESIIASIDTQYILISADTKFSKISKNPIDRRLDISSYFLALIKTLDEKAETFEKIRKMCLDITVACIRPKSRVHAYFRRLIPKVINSWLARLLLQALHKRVSVNNNSDGFIANIITDNQETLGFGYGIDIIECGICKLFKKHNYSKYASILCEIDEITSELAGLQLLRKGTIANGAKKCDFRFKTKE
ncbi:L-2-amino-thiazoline-4-carboxylic acid hydrolase (plasmid) [Leptospira sp. WS60.C2]